MPRLIILLLTLAALAILAVQNLSIPVSLVILGSARTPQIPFGLLLLGAVCIGALITLILYGLVGLRRPPESKYRPMGRRVPYPESPGSTTLPDSGPPYSSPGAAASPYSTASSSTAFVSEPAPAQEPPRDSAYAAPSSSYQYSSSYGDSPPSPEPPFNVEQPPFTAGQTVGQMEGQMEGRVEKKKSRFSRQEDPVESRRIGDDWGELNTAKHRNTWDTEGEGDRESGIAGAKQGFFDFIGIGNSPDRSSSRSGTARASDRDIDDLDSGWENYEGYENSAPPSAAIGKRVYSDGLYGDDIGPNGPYEDEGYENEGYEDDSVYEADYRVIEPPSQSLDDSEEEY